MLGGSESPSRAESPTSPSLSQWPRNLSPRPRAVGVVLQPTRRAFEETLRRSLSQLPHVARSAGVCLTGVHHGDPLPESLVLDAPRQPVVGHRVHDAPEPPPLCPLADSLQVPYHDDQFRSLASLTIALEIFGTGRLFAGAPFCLSV